MNELVARLSNGEHTIQVSRRKPLAAYLKERIELGHVHVFFEDTGTEIGISIDRGKSDYSGGDFENSSGGIHLEGFVTLNYEKVRCVIDVSLSDLKGKGMLVAASEEEYYSL